MIRPIGVIAAAWLSALVPAAAQTALGAGPAVAAAIEDLVVANRILAERGIIDAPDI